MPVRARYIFCLLWVLFCFTYCSAVCNFNGTQLNSTDICSQANSCPLIMANFSKIISQWNHMKYPIAHPIGHDINGLVKKDVTPLLTHWSYVFLALTHRCVISKSRFIFCLWLSEILKNEKRCYMCWILLSERQKMKPGAIYNFVIAMLYAIYLISGHPITEIVLKLFKKLTYKKLKPIKVSKKYWVS